MGASKNCTDLTKASEDFRSKPYLCPAGVPTIGYGSTRYPNGKKVSMDDPPISETQASEMLAHDIKTFEIGVEKLTKGVSLTQGQFDALVDFAYNLGLGALKNSTLLKIIKADTNNKEISNEFRKWVKGGGKVLPGLIQRREKEIGLYWS